MTVIKAKIMDETHLELTQPIFLSNKENLFLFL